MRWSFTSWESAAAPTGYPPSIPRIKGVQAYANVSGMFLNSLWIVLPKSSAIPIELIIPETKKKGRREGMIILAHVFNPSRTALDAPDGFDIRAHKENAIMQTLKNLNKDFFK